MITPSYRQGIFEKGIAQERKEIVHNMHSLGFDMPTIANVTGLSVEQVQALLSGDSG